MKFKELREFAERTAKDWMMSVDDVDVIVNEGEIEYRILKRFRNYRTGRDRLIHRIGKRRRRHK